MLKPHQTVTIYEDPITRQKIEGKAVLLHRLDADMGTVDNGHLERWSVCFEGEDGTVYDRMILVED